MASIKTVFEKTAVPQNMAEKIYHIGYYLSLIVNLKDNETVACEIKDDCHIEFADKIERKLIQLKHTISTNKEDKPCNLEDKDKDLWHTISNWIDVIKDEADGRKEITKQIAFVTTTTFELVTNKQLSQNKFYLNLEQLKSNVITTEDFIENIKTLIGEKNSEIDSYILKFISEKIWLEAFIRRISITEIDYDTLKEQTIKKLEEKCFLKKNHATAVYSKYLSNLLDDIYKEAGKKKIETNEADSKTHLKECIDYYTMRNLNEFKTVKIDDEIPEHIKNNMAEQIFIKQLKDIEAINDEEEIEDLTKLRYRADNSFTRWVTDEALIDPAAEFKKENLLLWSNAFNKIYNSKNKRIIQNTQEKEQLLIDLGQECLNNIKEHRLIFNNYELETSLSNGHFYWLSDKVEIGFRFDWKEKYGA